MRRAMLRVLSDPGRPAARLIWIYSIGMMAFMAMNGVLALFLQARFAVTERSIGYFYTYVGTISLVMRSLILGPVVKRLGEARVLRLGIGTMTVGYALLPFAPTVPVFAAVVLLMPIGTALLFPSTTSLVSRFADPGELGATMGVQQAYGGIARLSGPIWAGIAFQHLGPGAPFWISSVLIVATFGFAAGLGAAPVSPETRVADGESA